MAIIVIFIPFFFGLYFYERFRVSGETFHFIDKGLSDTFGLKGMFGIVLIFI